MEPLEDSIRGTKVYEAVQKYIYYLSEASLNALHLSVSDLHQLSLLTMYNGLLGGYTAVRLQDNVIVITTETIHDVSHLTGGG